MPTPTTNSPPQPSTPKAVPPLVAPSLDHDSQPAQTTTEPSKTEPIRTEPIETIPAGPPEAVPTPPELTPSSYVPVVLTLLVALLFTFFLRRLARLRAMDKIHRWIPLAHIVVWTVVFVVVAWRVALRIPEPWLVVYAALLLIPFIVGLSWLRSTVAGITIALERRLHLGDAVRIGDIDGEVLHFGLRTIRVRCVDGTIHEIPNERFLAEPVASLSGNGGDSACEFTVEAPPELPVDQVLELARRAAYITPLASPRHSPEVFIATPEHYGRREVRIRGYAFDPTYQDHFRSDVLARILDAFERATPRATATEPDARPNKNRKTSTILTEDD